MNEQLMTTTADYGLARRMWHQLEPVHAVFWYAPEVFAEAAGLGYDVATRWPSYFAWRRGWDTTWRRAGRATSRGGSRRLARPAPSSRRRPATASARTWWPSMCPPPGRW